MFIEEQEDIGQIADLAECGYVGYTNITDSATAGTVYFGYAPCGTATSAAKWRIKKTVTAANVATVTWANAGIDDQVWDNRASLTYS